MNHLRVTLDSSTVNLAQAISESAHLGLLVVLTASMFADLSAELGSDEAAMQHLRAVATAADRPIGCNFPTADGSRTAFIPPPGWTEERLAGFVAARHEELEMMFGPAVPHSAPSDGA